ncbi:MAG TPA: ABC transporter permease [Candidatus Acidoferrales bacterium]|nr:ABC transporter permease [Candidatus Acidoferrales bacterium]
MNTPVGIVNDIVKDKILAVQEFTLLGWRAFRNLFGHPRYLADTFEQMDIIGVGSLPIVVLASFFIGAVLVLQTADQFVRFGSPGLTGDVVSLALVREIGPVIIALLVAGRVSSGIASELGSMQVSEQIDAMRALGTDPLKKLVTPRLVATVAMLPLLTIIGDFVGLLGGLVVSNFVIRLNPTQYWTRAYQAIELGDAVQGLAKPFVFAFIVSLVGCYYGLTTRGGTQGVGRSTTQAVVVASVLILVSNLFITKTILWVNELMGW